MRTTHQARPPHMIFSVSGKASPRSRRFKFHCGGGFGRPVGRGGRWARGARLGGAKPVGGGAWAEHLVACEALALALLEVVGDAEGRRLLIRF